MLFKVRKPNLQIQNGLIDQFKIQDLRQFTIVYKCSEHLSVVSGSQYLFTCFYYWHRVQCLLFMRRMEERYQFHSMLYSLINLCT